MSDEDLTRRIHGVGALTEPVRRALYLFVAGRPEPVSRDAAAAGVGVARHLAKFHLDRLVDEGLLETHFERLTGRTGPGAGRPAKLYRRAAGEVAVSLPERQYRLAGQLMATAIDASVAHGVPVMDALADVAARHGRQIAAATLATGFGVDDEVADVVGHRGPGAGSSAAGRGGTASSGGGAPEIDAGSPLREEPGDPASPLDRVCAALADQGYEPTVSGDEVVLRNCPFHALAVEHTALVCGMNLAMLGSFADALEDGAIRARLTPGPGRCCVVLSRG